MEPKTGLILPLYSINRQVTTTPNIAPDADPYIPPDFKYNRFARSKGVECCYNVFENSNRIGIFVKLNSLV
jgi:hypothetical protein